MKVIHFLNELKYSGAEIMYVDAAPIFQKLGCELTVVNTAQQMGEYAEFFREVGYDIKQLEIPYGLRKQWYMRHKLVDLLKSGHYEVVHIHRSDLRWIMSYCAHKAGCKAIYTAHNVFRSHWYSYPLHFLQRWTAQHWYGCIFQTISDSVDYNERRYYHIHTHKVYNWYGANRFYPAIGEEKTLAREKLKISTDALVIVSIGGCSSVKRHTDILKALPEVIKMHPNTLYLHLGEGTSLNEERSLVNNMGLQQYVMFCGNQKDVRKYLIVSDIYVMPSRFEGIPITTIEAMATGVPCVLYDVPGLRDFNKEQETSILIKENYHLLADTICRLYEDKKLQKQLTSSAMELVHRKYFMPTNVKKIFDLYNNLA